MVKGTLKRRVIVEADLRRFARRIHSNLVRFAPSRVVYLKEGGRRLGEILAQALGAPVHGIDVSYPLSRILNALPGPVRGFAWPVKELSYRLSDPKMGALPVPQKTLKNQRILLADDSASTGRSLRAVQNALRDAGIPRDQIRVVVFRCGVRAMNEVDWFETGDRVLFGER